MDKAMTAVEPEAVTTKIASIMFSVTEGKLRHMCITRKINARKVGKYWFVPVAELRKIFKGEE